MFEIRPDSPMQFSKHLDDSKLDLNQKQCGICNQKLKSQQFSKLCHCDHDFCLDCLKYYTLHKIRNEFEIIQCPKEDCKGIINEESETFKNLPQNLRFRYGKIVQNLKVLSNPSYRICPNCDGTQLNQVKGEDNLFCKKCVTKYCKICLNPAHSKYARCDNSVIGILKRNFQFRRCSNCLFVVEKNQGCNHMTCMCKYEFCYLCGGNWNHGDHQCPPKPVYVRPRSVRLIKREIPQRKTLALVPINLSFNPEENINVKAKGNRIQKYYKLFPPINRKPTQRNAIQLQNNSFLINNVSRVSQKQN